MRRAEPNHTETPQSADSDSAPGTDDAGSPLVRTQAGVDAALAGVDGGEGQHEVDDLKRRISSIDAELARYNQRLETTNTGDRKQDDVKLARCGLQLIEQRKMYEQQLMRTTTDAGKEPVNFHVAAAAQGDAGGWLLEKAAVGISTNASGAVSDPALSEARQRRADTATKLAHTPASPQTGASTSMSSNAPTTASTTVPKLELGSWLEGLRCADIFEPLQMLGAESPEDLLLLDEAELQQLFERLKVIPRRALQAELESIRAQAMYSSCGVRDDKQRLRAITSQIGEDYSALAQAESEADALLRNLIVTPGSDNHPETCRRLAIQLVRIRRQKLHALVLKGELDEILRSHSTGMSAIAREGIRLAIDLAVFAKTAIDTSADSTCYPSETQQLQDRLNCMRRESRKLDRERNLEHEALKRQIEIGNKERVQLHAEKVVWCRRRATGLLTMAHRVEMVVRASGANSIMPQADCERTQLLLRTVNRIVAGVPWTAKQIDLDDDFLHMCKQCEQMGVSVDELMSQAIAMGSSDVAQDSVEVDALISQQADELRMQLEQHFNLNAKSSSSSSSSSTASAEDELLKRLEALK